MEQSTAPTDWNQVQDFQSDVDFNARYSHDSKLHVQFYLRPMIQPTLSEEAQRPIFADVVHVRILVPGDKLSMVDRPASDDDKKRFTDHYAKFSAGQKDQLVGTRLEAVPFMTRSKVEEYKFFGIHTVEQLAEASDEVGQKFAGFNTDKTRAQKFLEASSGTDARVTDLEAKIAKLLADAEERDAAQAVLSKPAAKPAQVQIKQ